MIRGVCAALTHLFCALVLAFAPQAANAGAYDFEAITYNVGTNEGLNHDGDPFDGYTQAEAAISDDWYGNGLAWLPAIQAATSFFALHQPEVVAFQEIFYSPDCATIPTAYHVGFECETWQPGDPILVERVLGPNYQIACNLGKPDKCLAVRNDFGHFAGCSGTLCLDGLDGVNIPGCGGGSRIGRGTVQLTSGGTLTLVSVHGTSGIADADRDCRVAQFAQIFEDFDGEPAANGFVNLIMGDFNVDPARWIGFDPSANLLNLHAPYLGGGDFDYVSGVGPSEIPTYLGYFNLDRQISDALSGSCTAPGVGGVPPVLATTYFDHTPILCSVPEPTLAHGLCISVALLLRFRSAREVRSESRRRRDYRSARPRES